MSLANKVDGMPSGRGAVYATPQYANPMTLRGAPLFSQLSQAAKSSAVGVFSLRAVNGVTARAVQVARGAIGTFPPISMTSDNFTATGTYNGIVNGVYVSSASTYYIASGTEQPYRFFDKNNNGTWWTTSSGSYSTSTGLYTAGVYSTTISGSPYAGEWIQIQLPAKVFVTAYTIYNSASWNSRAPVDFKIAGSTDGTNWTLVDTQTGITSWLSSTTNLTFTPSNPGAYSYYRLCVNKCGVGTGGYLSIGEWVLNSSATDFYADRLGNLLTAPVTGQSLQNWLTGATGYVTTWYDQSGAGNHATQAMIGYQPTIDPYNNLIYFASTDTAANNQYLSPPDAVFPNLSSFTISCRHTTIANSGDRGVYGAGQTLGNNYNNSLIKVSGSNSYKSYFLGLDFTNGTYSSGNRLTLKYSQTTGTGVSPSNGTRYMYVNGTQSGSQATTGWLGNGAAGSFIGRGSYTGSIEGGLYYMVMFNTDISDSDRAIIESI